MPAKNQTSSIKSNNGSGGDVEANSFEMRDRRTATKRPYRLSAEIDEPLLREGTLRGDDGALLHDDISSLEGSDDEVEEKVEGDSSDDDEFAPRRKSISEPARIIGRTGDRFRNLENFNLTGGFQNKKGMSVGVTSFFIIGETAGGGLVALPIVISVCGLVLGALVLVLGAAICGYAGDQLAQCWNIMMLRYPKYRSHTHKPYPAIARRAIGKKAGSAVQLMLNFTQFGTAVVFILLGSKNLTSFLLWAANKQVSFGWVTCLFSLLVFPLTLLRSPKDFAYAIVLAMITTITACGLLLFGGYLDFATCAPVNVLPEFDINRILQSFGTVMFAYGGHGAFPTIQHDMKEPHKFSKAVKGAFTGIAALYLPVAIFTALVYGSSLVDVVIYSVQYPAIQQAINACITIHVFLALTIVFNPINQDFEAFCNVPDEFTIKRVAVRGGVLFCVVFIALSFPNFGPLLDLVGASTITAMAIILPPLFSLYLHARLSKFGTKGSKLEPLRLSDLYTHNDFGRFFWNICLITLGVVGGGMSSWMAMKTLAYVSFHRPCYGEAFMAFIGFPLAPLPVFDHGNDFGIPITDKFMCCGPFRNVSALGPNYCLDVATIAGGGSHG